MFREIGLIWRIPGIFQRVNFAFSFGVFRCGFGPAEIEGHNWVPGVLVLLRRRKSYDHQKVFARSGRIPAERVLKLAV